MTSGESQPRELSRYIHLFLSGKEEKKAESSAPAEYSIWLIVLGAPVFRAYFSGGIASFLSEGNNRVTLLEAGSGLPNSGYYFALSPQEYTLAALDRDGGFSKIISPSLRVACSAGFRHLPSFKEGFGGNEGAHIILSAFGSDARFGRDFIDMISEKSSEYSLCGPPSDIRPDAALILNLPGRRYRGGIPEIIARYAPEAGFFVGGLSGDDFPEGAEPGILELPDPAELDLERRSPPDGPAFRSFVNSFLQRASSSLRRGEESAAG